MSLLDDIGAKLTSDGVVGGATGWTLGKSYLPPSPDQVVALFETAGPEADQTEGTRYDEPTFQVRARGATFEYDQLRDKMTEVFNSLNDATIAGFVFVFAVQSGPLPLGYDENNRPELSWNFATMKQRA